MLPFSTDAVITVYIISLFLVFDFNSEYIIMAKVLLYHKMVMIFK